MPLKFAKDKPRTFTVPRKYLLAAAALLGATALVQPLQASSLLGSLTGTVDRTVDTVGSVTSKATGGTVTASGTGESTGSTVGASVGVGGVSADATVGGDSTASVSVGTGGGGGGDGNGGGDNGGGSNGGGSNGGGSNGGGSNGGGSNGGGSNGGGNNGGGGVGGGNNGGGGIGIPNATALQSAPRSAASSRCSAAGNYDVLNGVAVFDRDNVFLGNVVGGYTSGSDLTRVRVAVSTQAVPSGGCVEYPTTGGRATAQGLVVNTTLDRLVSALMQ